MGCRGTSAGVPWPPRQHLAAGRGVPRLWDTSALPLSSTTTPCQQQYPHTRVNEGLHQCSRTQATQHWDAWGGGAGALALALAQVVQSWGVAAPILQRSSVPLPTQAVAPSLWPPAERASHCLIPHLPRQWLGDCGGGSRVRGGCRWTAADLGDRGAGAARGSGQDSFPPPWVPGEGGGWKGGLIQAGYRVSTSQDQAGRGAPRLGRGSGDQAGRGFLEPVWRTSRDRTGSGASQSQAGQGSWAEISAVLRSGG